MRSLIAVLLCCVAFPVQAQVQCGPTKEVDATLRDKLKLHLVNVGLINEQAYLSIYAGPDGEGWTAVVTDSEGKSCLLAQGSIWFQGKVPVSGDPA